MPDKDRYQATSKVSHHETAAQRSLDSSVDRAQRALAHCRDGAPESSDKYGQREDAQVDEWQQRCRRTSETFPLVKMNTSLVKTYATPVKWNVP